MAKSTCAGCRDPGYCCRSLTLTTVFPAEMLREEVNRHVAEGTDPYRQGYEYERTPQFEALHISSYYIRRGQSKPDGVKWSFACQWLGGDGRCMNYRRRPELCKTYKPKADLLCIEYDGSYAGALLLYRGE